jgi:hypothetical protein
MTWVVRCPEVKERRAASPHDSRAHVVPLQLCHGRGESTIQSLLFRAKSTAPILLPFSGMPLSGSLLIRVAPLFLVTWLAAACEGETFSGGAQPGDGPGVQSADSGTGTGMPESGSACIDFEATAADFVCERDQDCTVVRTGEVCTGECACGDIPVNAGAAARFETESTPLTFLGCSCAYHDVHCLTGQCTLCGPDIPNRPAACSDAGIESAEDGGVVDGGSKDGGVEDGGIGVVEAGERDSSVKTADSGGDTGTTDAGPKCVDFEPTLSDLTCGSDQDCALVRTGEVCKSQCSCGDTPVNAGAAARFASDTAPLDLASCPCAFEGEPRCIAGQCTLCGFGGNQPAGCADAAAPSPGTDGGMCVDIDLSTYDQSCVRASDCIVILTGEVCSSECTCGGSPVNGSEQPRYEEATSGITFGKCFCPVELAPSCVGNKCVLPVAVPLNP